MSFRPGDKAIVTAFAYDRPPHYHIGDIVEVVDLMRDAVSVMVVKPYEPGSGLGPAKCKVRAVDLKHLPDDYQPKTTFSVGDTVRLKSGGPTMTVTVVSQANANDSASSWVECSWFSDENGQAAPKSVQFHPDALTPFGPLKR